MDQEFQSGFESKSTQSLVWIVLKCAVLVPAMAIGLVYAVFSFQGMQLGHKEWKNIVFFVWTGTIFLLVVTVLRKRRTARGEGTLLNFPGREE